MAALLLLELRDRLNSMMCAGSSAAPAPRPSTVSIHFPCSSDLQHTRAVSFSNPSRHVLLEVEQISMDNRALSLVTTWDLSYVDSRTGADTQAVWTKVASAWDTWS